MSIRIASVDDVATEMKRLITEKRNVHNEVAKMLNCGFEESEFEY